MTELGHEPAMRLVDGEPALPDELPPENWSELRIAVADAMLTLRREAGGFRLITWENPSEALQQACEDLARVLTEEAGRDGGAT